MKKNKKGLKLSIKWLNELPEGKKGIVYDFIEKDCIFGLDDDDYSELKDLRNFVIDIIIDNSSEKDTINKLILAGLDEEVAKKLYDHCNILAIPLKNSKTVNKLALDQLKDISKFVINKVFIYEEFHLYPFEYFAKTYNFNNIDEAKDVVNFLFNMYSRVIVREISPDTLRIILEKQYELPVEKINIIVDNLANSINEMQMSFLVNTLYKLTDLLNSEDLDIEDSKEKE